MKTITVPTAATVSPANQAIFEQLKKGLGMVPNLYATLAYSEHGLGNYLTLQNGKSSLSAKEREVINLVVSQVNECAYCLAAHTVLGGMVGFQPAQIIEIRRGGASFDVKLNALAGLVKSAAENRGHASQDSIDAFFAAGYSEGNLVDAVIVIGDKIIRTHFINRHEMRSSQKGCWQGVRRVAWWDHAQGAQRGQRPFWEEPGGSGLFGRIAAFRIGVKTSSLDPDSRLALHPKQGKLALAPIYEMSSTNYLHALTQVPVDFPAAPAL